MWWFRRRNKDYVKAINNLADAIRLLATSVQRCNITGVATQTQQEDIVEQDEEAYNRVRDMLTKQSREQMKTSGNLKMETGDNTAAKRSEQLRDMQK